LSLAESSNQPEVNLPVNLIRLAQFRDREISSPDSPYKSFPLSTQIGIMPELQYREPNAIGKKWIATYAHHVARKYRHQEKPDLDVLSVKVYRVIHRILNPELLVAGIPPNDPEMYQPFFLGEFDKEGNIKSYPRAVRLLEPNGVEYEVYRDPLLYWYIPIVRVAPGAGAAANPFAVGSEPTRPGELPAGYLQVKPKNYLAVHAGDAEEP
jgi:hypothetical protein